jgi:hypothetical protein
LPLLLSQGAGAEMRRTLGTTVFSGMLGVTLFGIVLTPVFFVVIDWLGSHRVFHSGPVRKVSDAVLWVLLFVLGGWAAMLVRVVSSELRRRKPPTPPAGPRTVPVPVLAEFDGNGSGHGNTEGNGNGNGNGNGHGAGSSAGEAEVVERK